GDTLFKIQLDPYEVSLRHVGTHLLLTDLNEAAVRDALEKGRAFVGFDWIADSTGFDFAAVSPSGRHEMGGRVPLKPSLKLHAIAPLVVKWKLVANGRAAVERTGRTFEFPVTEPGNYRIEAWLTLAGEELIWILSNPIYIRAAAANNLPANP